MKKFLFVMVAALSLAAMGCKKKSAGGEAMAKMEGFADDMCKCKDAACVTKVSEAMQKWSTEQKPDKDYKPTEEDTKKGTEVMKKMQECTAKAAGGGGAMGGGGSGEAPAGGSDKPAGSGEAPAAGGGDLPAECTAYKDAIAKLAACDKMPQQARDALKQAYDQASTGWAGLPAEAKAGLATACKAGADAVMQSGKAVCGW